MMISRKGYYSNLDVLFEIIKQTIHRETFFLPYEPNKEGKLESKRPIRWLNASFINMLKKHWQRYKFLENPMNLYYSMATYKDFPVFSYSWRKKSQEQVVWSKEYNKHLLKLDLFLETDCEDISKSQEDIIALRDVLNEYKIVHSIKFSGSKGFHSIIPFEEFFHLGLEIYEDRKERSFRYFDEFLQSLPVPLAQLGTHFDLVLLYKTINVKLAGIYALDTLDVSISDILRVCKTAYSYDVKSNNIALPLTDEQLEQFSLDMVNPVNVLKAGVHKRGLLYRNTEKCKLIRKLAILKFLEELGIAKP